MNRDSFYVGWPVWLKICFIAIILLLPIIFGTILVCLGEGLYFTKERVNISMKENLTKWWEAIKGVER